MIKLRHIIPILTKYHVPIDLDFLNLGWEREMPISQFYTFLPKKVQKQVSLHDIPKIIKILNNQQRGLKFNSRKFVESVIPINYDMSEEIEWSDDSNSSVKKKQLFDSIKNNLREPAASNSSQTSTKINTKNKKRKNNNTISSLQNSKIKKTKSNQKKFFNPRTVCYRTRGRVNKKIQVLNKQVSLENLNNDADIVLGISSKTNALKLPTRVCKILTSKCRPRDKFTKQFKPLKDNHTDRRYLLNIRYT